MHGSILGIPRQNRVLESEGSVQMTRRLLLRRHCIGRTTEQARGLIPDERNFWSLS